MVGWARLAVSGERGTRVQLRFAEMLEPDGSLYLTNLRSARQLDTFVLAGAGREVFEPRFTFHGFRYVEVTGADDFELTGCVVHSDTPAQRLSSSARTSSSTSCGATSTGASAATSSRSRPTARSATSASAGSPTPRSSSPPRR